MQPALRVFYLLSSPLKGKDKDMKRLFIHEAAITHLFNCRTILVYVQGCSSHCLAYNR